MEVEADFKGGGPMPSFINSKTGELYTSHDLTANMNAVSAWGRGVGIGDLYETMRMIFANPLMVLPLPNGLDHQSEEHKEQIINLLCGTPLGTRTGLPAQPPADSWTPTARAYNHGAIVRLCEKLSLQLRGANTAPATADRAPLTRHPDIFDGEQPESNHALRFFFQLRKLDEKHKNSPGMSRPHVKRDVMDPINIAITSIKSLHELEDLRTTTNNNILRANGAYPDAKEQLETEVGEAILEAALAALKWDKEASPRTQMGVRKWVEQQYEAQSRDAQHGLFTWTSINDSLAKTLAKFLPPRNGPTTRIKAQGDEERVYSALEVSDIVAKVLAAQHTPPVPKPPGMARPPRAAPRDKDGNISSNWMCTRCGGLGHDHADCNLPVNPQAAEMVKKHAAELRAASARKRLAGSRDKSRPGQPPMQPQAAAFLAEIMTTYGDAHENRFSRSANDFDTIAFADTVETEEPPTNCESDGTDASTRAFLEGITRKATAHVTPVTHHDHLDTEMPDTNEQPTPPSPLLHAMTSAGSWVAEGMCRAFEGVSDGAQGAYTAGLGAMLSGGLFTVLLLTSILGLTLESNDAGSIPAAIIPTPPSTPRGLGLKTLNRIGLGISLLALLLTANLVTVTPPPTNAPSDTSHTFAFAAGKGGDYSIMSLVGSCVFVDSGCSSEGYFGDAQLLINRRPVPTRQVKGISGFVNVTEAGDYPFCIQDDSGRQHDFVIPNISIREGSTVNLLGVQNLNDIGIGINFRKAGEAPTINFTADDGHEVTIEISRVNNLFPFPSIDNQITYHAHYAASTNSTFEHKLTAEELWHRRLAHLHASKLTQLSTRCIGIPRALKYTNSAPCHMCQDAKAVRNANRQPSDNSPEGLWSMDLFDVGDEHKSLGGFRYLTIFVVASSRYCVVVPHKRKSDAVDVFLRAVAIIGRSPTTLRRDNAAEYTSTEFTDTLTRLACKPEQSCPHEQAGNARAETMVNSIGKGMRAQLLDANAGTEFWLFAATNWVEVYNRSPHDALNGTTPWEAEKGTLPDVSAFRPFGCRATAFRGKSQVEHHKLSARGSPCVYVGLGNNKGMKGWLCWSPDLNRLFCTRNVQFDETFMPLRPCDQRVRSATDPTPSTSMLKSAYGGTAEADGIAQEIETMTHTFTNDDYTNDDEELHDIAQHHSPEMDALLDPSTDPTPPTPVGEGSTPTPISEGAPGGALPGGVPVSRPKDTGGANSGSWQPPPPSGGDNSQAEDVGEDAKTQTAAENDWIRVVGSRHITQATDDELIDWLTFHSINISFPSTFWYKTGKKGECWPGTVIDKSNGAKGPTQAKVFFPTEKEHRRFAYVNMSNGKNNVRGALEETFPSCKTLKDILELHQSREALKGLKGTPRQRPSMSKRAAQTVRFVLTAAQEALNIDTPAVHYKRASTLRARGDTEGAEVAAYYAASMLCMSLEDYGPSVTEAAALPMEPKTQREARSRPDAALWEKAEAKELDTLFKMGTFEVVDKPDSYDPLPCKFTYKRKVEDGNFENSIYKARLVMQGNMMYEDEFGETYTPTARMWVVRMLTSIAAQKGLLAFKFDLKGAFMVASQPDENEIYVTIPGFPIPEGKAIRLRKALYGGRSSGALYFSEISTFLKEYGFKATSTDSTLYRLYKNGKMLLLSLYIDDGMVVTDSEPLYREFLAALSARYNLSDSRVCDWHLGVKFTRDWEAGTITLDQRAYSESMLRRFGMDECTPKSSPMRSHLRLSKDDCPERPDAAAVKLYQQIVGSLLYLSCCTRPDIALAVGQCAQYMSNPGPSHMEAAKHILRYIKGTLHVGLTYGNAAPGMENLMYGYVDADHAACTDDRKSVAGYALMLNSAAISWSSRKIKVTSLSSFESEWYAASICGCEVEVLRRTLEEIGFAQASPTTLYEDNAACIYSSDKNRPMSARSRHIDTRVYKLRDLTNDGIVRLVKIATDSQMADCLTKALPAAAVETARDYLCGQLQAA